MVQYSRVAQVVASWPATEFVRTKRLARLSSVGLRPSSVLSPQSSVLSVGTKKSENTALLLQKCSKTWFTCAVLPGHVWICLYIPNLPGFTYMYMVCNQAVILILIRIMFKWNHICAFVTEHKFQHEICKAESALVTRLNRVSVSQHLLE